MVEIAVLVLCFALFFIPELFRTKNQKYEYPKVPDAEPEIRRTILYSGGKTVMYSQTDTAEGISSEWEMQDVKPKVVMSAAKAVMPAINPAQQIEEANPWTGQLSLPHIVNGIIFAEIMQPPRAMRRMRRVLYRWNR